MKYTMETQIRASIAALRSAGRPYDYLQQRLIDITGKPSHAVEMFQDDYVQKPIFFSGTELAQMHTFGYVVTDNSEANLEALRNTPQYRYQVSKGVNLGF